MTSYFRESVATKNDLLILYVCKFVKKRKAIS